MHRQQFFILAFSLIIVSTVAFAQSLDQKCYDSCKENCLAAGGELNECAMVCTEKCTLENEIARREIGPLQTAPLGQKEVRGRMMEYAKVVTAVAHAPSCEERCRAGAYSVNAPVFNQELYDRCVKQNCQPPDCRTKCEQEFANDKALLQKCLIERCTPRVDCARDCKNAYGNEPERLRECLTAKCKLSQPNCEDDCNARVVACEAQSNSPQEECPAVRENCLNSCLPDCEARCGYEQRECEARRLRPAHPQTGEPIPCGVFHEMCLQSLCPSCLERCAREFPNSLEDQQRCFQRCAPKMGCKEKCENEFRGSDDAVKKCIIERCEPKRNSCEERCRPLFQTCVNQCEHSCPRDCSTDCSSAYLDCSSRARKDAAGSEVLVGQCRAALASCLDICPAERVLRPVVALLPTAEPLPRDKQTPELVAKPTPEEVIGDCRSECERGLRRCVDEGGVIDECQRTAQQCVRNCEPAKPGLFAKMWSTVFG